MRRGEVLVSVMMTQNNAAPASPADHCKNIDWQTWCWSQDRWCCVLSCQVTVMPRMLMTRYSSKHHQPTPEHGSGPTSSSSSVTLSAVSSLSIITLPQHTMIILHPFLSILIIKSSNSMMKYSGHTRVKNWKFMFNLHQSDHFGLKTWILMFLIEIVTHQLIIPLTIHCLHMRSEDNSEMMNFVSCLFL